jgi:hypothetical protein
MVREMLGTTTNTPDYGTRVYNEINRGMFNYAVYDSMKSPPVNPSSRADATAVSERETNPSGVEQGTRFAFTNGLSISELIQREARFV